jgi:hypothetical protein
MKLIIRESDGLVAEIEDYRGPIPRAGEYIFHPPLDDDGFSDLSVHGTNVMSVKSVTYGIITRPRKGENHFVGRPGPVVEIWV